MNCLRSLNIRGKKNFILISFCCLTFVLYGQSFTKLEFEFQKLNQVLSNEQIKLDSLNSLHNNLVSVIDKEKQKDEADKEKIINLLASTVVISNQVKEQQIKLDKIENEIESIKKTLDVKYAIVIDSLKKLENSGNYSGNKELLKSQIINYIEKRLIVTPKIFSLSFNPQKLLQFKSSSKDDTLEQKIYKEYLNNALLEVDTQVEQITLLKDEVQEIIFLRNEANAFIEDIDSDIRFNPILQSSDKSAGNELVFAADPRFLGDGTSKINFQANSYLHLFNQLKLSSDVELQSPWQTPMDSIPANLTFQQYLDLLVEVDKMLQDYRIILKHKLESN